MDFSICSEKHHYNHQHQWWSTLWGNPIRSSGINASLHGGNKPWRQPCNCLHHLCACLHEVFFILLLGAIATGFATRSYWDWLIFDRSCLPRIEEKLQLSRQDKVCYRYRESFKPFTKSNKDTCSLFALGLKLKSKEKKQYFIFSFFFSYEDIMKWVQTRYAGIHFNQFNRDDFIWDNLPVMWTMLFKPTIENPTR